MAATVDATEAFLRENPAVASSPEAALALAAAAAIDDLGSSTTSRSMVMGRYLEALSALRAMVPEKREVTVLDEIRARRDAKLGRASTAG